MTKQTRSYTDKGKFAKFTEAQLKIALDRMEESNSGLLGEIEATLEGIVDEARDLIGVLDGSGSFGQRAAAAAPHISRSRYAPGQDVVAPAAPKRGRGRPKKVAAIEEQPTAATSAHKESSGRPAAGGKKRRAGSAGRRGAITPEQAASRRLQGRYLGLIRQVKGRKREEFQRTAKALGREQAVAELEKYLGK